MPNYNFYQSLKPSDKLTLNKTLTDSTNSADDGWITMSTTAADAIWIELQLSGTDLTVTGTGTSAPKINSLGLAPNTFVLTDNAWTSTAYVSKATNHTLRILLATGTVITNSTTGNKTANVTQIIRSDLVLLNTVIDGIATRWAFPH